MKNKWLDWNTTLIILDVQCQSVLITSWDFYDDRVEKAALLPLHMIHYTHHTLRVWFKHEPLLPWKETLLVATRLQIKSNSLSVLEKDLNTGERRLRLIYFKSKIFTFEILIEINTHYVTVGHSLNIEPALRRTRMSLNVLPYSYQIWVSGNLPSNLLFKEIREQEFHTKEGMEMRLIYLKLKIFSFEILIETMMKSIADL